MAKVVVLFEGYSRNLGPLERGDREENCTCTLIKGKKNIIVDTMTAWDGDRIQEGILKSSF